MSDDREKSGQKGRLLIVEDEPNFAALMSLALRKEGYLVEIVGSVEEAQDYLQREKVDLLITDWVLPDGTGGQVCAMARTIKTTNRPLPMIVLSGALTQRSQTITECKPDVFLSKPIRMAHLLLHVHDLLSISSST